MKKKWKVAIVGASGMVGGELLYLLEKRKFPISSIGMFSSGRKDSFAYFKGKKYRCEKDDLEKLSLYEIVFFVSNEEVSEKYAFKLAEKGIWCIDDSSRFRMDPTVPLIIPEINAHLINPRNRVIAGPNCTLTPLAVGCARIHKKYAIKEIRLSTYQAVSGAGRRAIEQLFNEIYGYVKGKKKLPHKKVLPQQIAFNLIPQVGSFDKEGFSSEENKVANELRKIWNDTNIKISVTAVRVPTIRVHCLSAWIKTQKPWTKKDLEREFSKTPGARYVKYPDYSTPLSLAKSYDVTISRLRATGVENEFCVWLCGDNLYKGAALNSIQIAERIVHYGERHK